MAHRQTNEFIGMNTQIYIYFHCGRTGGSEWSEWNRRISAPQRRHSLFFIAAVCMYVCMCILCMMYMKYMMYMYMYMCMYMY